MAEIYLKDLPRKDRWEIECIVDDIIEKANEKGNYDYGIGDFTPDELTQAIIGSGDFDEQELQSVISDWDSDEPVQLNTDYLVDCGVWVMDLFNEYLTESEKEEEYGVENLDISFKEFYKLYAPSVISNLDITEEEARDWFFNTPDIEPIRDYVYQGGTFYGDKIDQIELLKARKTKKYLARQNAKENKKG